MSSVVTVKMTGKVFEEIRDATGKHVAFIFEEIYSGKRYELRSRELNPGVLLPLVDHTIDAEGELQGSLLTVTSWQIVS